MRERQLFGNCIILPDKEPDGFRLSFVMGAAFVKSLFWGKEEVSCLFSVYGSSVYGS